MLTNVEAIETGGPTSRSSEREPAVSLGVKYERHRRLAPVADLR